MEAKDVRFKILINNSETQLIKHFFRWQFVLIENYFSLKLFWIFSFKIDCITLDPDPDLDPDPNWARILDPDPNSMYLDPQHCCTVSEGERRQRVEDFSTISTKWSMSQNYGGQPQRVPKGKGSMQARRIEVPVDKDGCELNEDLLVATY